MTAVRPSAWGEGRRVHATGRASTGAAPIIGSSVVMCEVRSRIERIAATDFTVLIEGESGTGKELVAHQLHDLSDRRRGPFVSVNCAALVESLLEAELFGIEDRTATGVRGRAGKFEAADSGTLFLDEIADLSRSAQAKLLRVLQDGSIERVGSVASKRVRTRVIAATNQTLSRQVERGAFRADLFYRLSGVDLRVPPLRERREDILELVRYFMDQHGRGRPLTLSEAARNALLIYDWPGNVRELERLVESTIALTRGPFIDLDDLPAQVKGRPHEILGPSLAQNESLRAWASRYARLVLAKSGFNKRRACRVLGISYHTLQAYLEERWRHRDRRSAPEGSLFETSPGARDATRAVARER